VREKIPVEASESQIFTCFAIIFVTIVLVCYAILASQTAGFKGVSQLCSQWHKGIAKSNFRGEARIGKLSERPSIAGANSCRWSINPE